MSTNTSTPLSLLNTSANPTLLSSNVTETSFHSVAPMTPTNNIPELPQNNINKKCLSKLYYFFLLMGVFICASFLIYLVIHVSLYMKLSGGLQCNGNFALQSEGALNLSSTVNSSINSSIKTSPTQLWEQKYVDDILS